MNVINREKRSPCPVCHKLFHHLGIARHMASHREQAKVKRDQLDKVKFPTMRVRLAITVNDTTSYLNDTEVTDWIVKAVQRKRQAMGLPDTNNIEASIQLIPKQ